MPKILLLVFAPFLCSALAFILGRNMKSPGIILSLLPLLFLIFGGTWIGEEINYSWFQPLGIHFHLKMDSLSLLFVALTALIVPISLLAAKKEDISGNFLGLVLLLQGLLIGFFTARDLVVFVIFWEAMLFPLYFLITLWGKEKAEKRL